IRCTVLEHACALGAGLARRHREIDQLALTKQPEVAIGGLEGVPFEAWFGDQYLALVEPGRARGGTDLVARLDREQRLVAMDDVQGTQSAGEVGGELGGTELHQTPLANRRRDKRKALSSILPLCFPL